MGKDFYSDPRADKVSLNRPGYYAHFYLWEFPFITWLEDNGFEVEYCTGIDLQVDTEFLNNYQLLLSVRPQTNTGRRRCETMWKRMSPMEETLPSLAGMSAGGKFGLRTTIDDGLL